MNEDIKILKEQIEGLHRRLDMVDYAENIQELVNTLVGLHNQLARDVHYMKKSLEELEEKL